MPAGRLDGVQPLNAASVMEVTIGAPDVVTVNDPARPELKVAEFPLVMHGDDPDPAL